MAEQDLLPFLLMGKNLNNPQMSQEVPLDQSLLQYQQTMNQQQTPQQPMPAFQVPAPALDAQMAPPTQEDLSAAAIGQPPADQQGEADYLASLDPLTKLFIKNYQDYQARQQKDLEQAKQRLSAAQQAQGQINLAPLAKLVDVWTGSNLSSGYIPPQPKDKIVQQLQDAVLKGRGDIAKTSADLVKSLMEIESRKESSQAAREDRALRRAETKAGQEVTRGLQEEKFQHAVEKDYDKEYGQNLRGLTDLADKSIKLKKIIEQKGDIWTGKTAAEIDSLSSQIATIYNRDVAKLGALAGADLSLIRSANNLRLQPQDYIVAQLKGGAPARKAILEMMIEDMKKTAAETEKLMRAKSTWNRIEKVFDADLSAFNKAIGGGSSAQQAQQTYSQEEINAEIARRQQAGGN